MKIAINKCYGGFSLSNRAVKQLKARYSHDYTDDKTKRKDPALIKVIEKLGTKANGAFADIAIVEVPDECTDYMIIERSGIEYLLYVVDGKIYKGC